MSQNAFCCFYCGIAVILLLLRFAILLILFQNVSHGSAFECYSDSITHVTSMAYDADEMALYFTTMVDDSRTSNILELYVNEKGLPLRSPSSVYSGAAISDLALHNGCKER